MTTELIRWNDGNEITGHVGACGPFAFFVSRVYLGANWQLAAGLPGFGQRLERRDDLGELKSVAESWLREFASSLGAVFATDLREHLEREAATHQELGADYDDQGDTLSGQENFARAEAYRSVVKFIEHELGTRQ
jgi:hypothetical protein